MERFKGVRVLSSGYRGTSLIFIALTLFATAGCNERLKRIEANQSLLQDKIDFNAHRTTRLAAHIAQSQEAFEQRIDEVQRANEETLAEAMATRYEQKRMADETREFDRKWFAGMTRMEEKQRRLQVAVNGVAGKAHVIDTGVRSLDSGQKKLQGQLAANRDVLEERLDDAAYQRDTLQATSSETLGRTTMVSQQVRALQQHQRNFRKLVNNHDQALMKKARHLTEGQETLQQSINQNAAVSQQIAPAVAAIRQDQDRIKTMVHEHSTVLNDTLSTLGHKQDQLQEQIQHGQQDSQNRDTAMTRTLEAVENQQATAQETLNGIDKTTKAILQQTTTIHERQQPMHESLIDENASMQAVIDKQDQLQRSLQGIQVTGDTLVNSTSTLLDRQTQADQSAQQQHAQLMTAMAASADTQRQLVKNIEDVQATGQTLVTQAEALKTGQTSLGQKVTSGDRELATQVGNVAQQQGGMQRAVQSMNADLAQRLDALEANYTQWQNRTERLSDKAQALETRLQNIDEGMTALQTNLSSRISDLATIIRYYQQRLPSMNDNIVNDLRGFSATLKQIQDAQNELSKRLDEVHTETQRQSEDLVNAVHSLRRQTQDLEEDVTKQPQQVEVPAANDVK